MFLQRASEKRDPCTIADRRRWATLCCPRTACGHTHFSDARLARTRVQAGQPTSIHETVGSLLNSDTNTPFGGSSLCWFSTFSTVYGELY